MKVEQHRPAACDRRQLRIDQWLAVVRQLPRREAALAERGLQPGGVALDVGRASGIARQREQFQELGNDDLSKRSACSAERTDWA